VPVAVRISSEQERKRKEARREATRQTILQVLLGVLFALLTFVAGLVLAIFIPPQIVNLLPNSILVALNFFDWHLVASQGLVDSTLGVFIGVVLWRTLGQKKQNSIAQAEAMMKYYHLKLTERDKKPFIIFAKLKQGYPLPFYLQGVASEGIIQEANDTEVKDIFWNKEEPNPEQLELKF